MNACRPIGAILALMLTAPAAAELPIPSVAAAPAQADPFLFYAGAGDIYEITSSVMAFQQSQSSEVRAFATMMIADHTQMTNSALTAVKGAGVMAPPAELIPAQKALIDQLVAAGPRFDRVFLEQQLAAHQQALAMHTAYASGGDNPALRATAAAAVPIVQGHIAHIQGMISKTP